MWHIGKITNVSAEPTLRKSITADRTPVNSVTSM
jgi:hypothetical protein